MNIDTRCLDPALLRDFMEAFIDWRPLATVRDEYDDDADDKGEEEVAALRSLDAAFFSLCGKYPWEVR